MKKILNIILIINLVTFATSPNLGTSGAQFLKLTADARSAALGSATVATSYGANSVFSNPAGVAAITQADVSLSYSRMFSMFDYTSVAVANNFAFGNFAILFTSFKTDEMEIITEKQPNGTGRKFDAQDFTLGISYGRFLTNSFSVGVTVKYVEQRIWNEKAATVAFDVGTRYTLDFNNLTIAMSMTNFAPDMKFDGEDLNISYDKDKLIPTNRPSPARLMTTDFPLPLNFQIGVALDLYKDENYQWLFEIDALHPNDNVERVHFATEINIFEYFSLRGGYKIKHDTENYSFGLGVKIPIEDYSILFDYAYVNKKYLSPINKITVSLAF
ncbi:MAG TPA: PorV/PorQ family protein [Ignavibacteriales bacterium]|mgnify:FL=1|nr:PorV/PorQ family protein [Ignavibacteriales bacterium]